MLRTAILLLTLSLLSFRTPVSPTIAGENLSAKAHLTALSGMTFEQKQLAFTEHVTQIYQELSLKNQGLALPVFQKAFVGLLNLKEQGLVPASKSILTVVDFTKSSNKKRMWVIDLASKKVLMNTLVAHGRNTGNVKAEKFSNTPNSFMSSMGFYVTSHTYYGKHGLSLRLKGMDEGFNSNAMERAIVVHGADYATDDFIKQYGRLGRSLGCPAVPTEISKELIETIKDETVLYVHSNDASYTSDYLNMKPVVENFATELTDMTVSI